LFDVKDTFSTDCQLAIGSSMKDYEDAIMVQTAIRIGADCIVTRNVKDYRAAALPVFSPEKFLEKLAENQNN
jgi:predicted nucleic acid-binding protein